MAERTGRQRGSETRDALLRAAAAVVEREGIAAVTTRRVASEAGLPLGTVHYWFTDKADLLAGVIEVLIADVRAGIAEGDADDTLTARLAGIWERVTAVSTARQIALVEVTTHSLRTEGLQHLAREQYAAYSEASSAALRPWNEAADAQLPGGSRALTALVLAVFDGLTLAELADPGDPDRAAAIPLLSHLLENALAGTPGSPKSSEE
ncbi:transcriptional regulator, TetR family [Rathayibacter oskolensis]|uniref:Transcriptional regulator, TetR family n=1 Tax=Rathayibacter oskolensis TaxID=1891671 RepID=A0A1X7PHM3_9MICO|nr:TetR/AcrR family transcriptional regulator [Rathayibacter oskolensis]SMH51046.1 transcriptional regulator, TetR family [Rathayibacter oskolensis]